MSTHSLSLVNVAPDSVLIGHAVIGLALAQAASREHLAAGIESFHFDREGGISIKVTDAGVRQHLANALNLFRDVTIRNLREGTMYARSGFHFEVAVTVWNLEP